MTKSIQTINSRLSRRIILYFILISTVITIFTSGLQVYSEFRRDVKEVEKSLDQIEKIYLPNIASRLWVLDTKELNTSINSLLGLHSVRYIEVYDNERLYLKTGSDFSENVMLKKFPLTYHNFDNENHIGYLVVKASLDNAYAHIFDRLIVIVSGNAVKTFLVTGIMLFVFYHLVIRHIVSFAGFAKNINFESLDSTFEFDRRNNPQGREDELDLLKSSIATMQNNLKRALEDLQKREQSLNITLNSIGDGVISTDAHGNIVRMNPVAEQLSGFSLEEAVGKPVSSIIYLVDAETREPVNISISQVIEFGNTAYISRETTLLSSNGSEHQVLLSLAPIRSVDGVIQGVVLAINNVTKQYHLRQVAVKTERNLRAVMEYSAAVIYIKSLDGRYLFVNRRFEEIFGLKYGDSIGQTDHELFSDDFADVFVKNDKAVLAAGHALKSEEVAPQLDGEHTYVSVKFPLLDDKGRVYALCGISTDITDRKNIEKELRNSEERYRTLMDNVPGANYRCARDKSRTMEFISKDIENICGYPESDFINNSSRTFASVIHQVDLSMVEKKVNEALEYKQPYAMEYRIIDRNNFVHWVFEKGRGVFNSAGELLYLDGVILDITKERQIREELLRKEQEQQDILNSIVDPVITIDVSGRIQTFNKAAELLFGYKENEIIGQAINLLMPPHYADNHDKYIKNYLETGEAHIIGEGRVVEGQRKDKSIFPMRLSVAELSEDKQGNRRFLGSCVDLTQLKQQEEQLRRSQKMDALGKLSGGVAHDYNNLIGIIVGYSDLLINTVDKDSSQGAYAREIRHAANRGAKLTQKLLSFSRQKAPDAEILNVNNLLNESRHMLEKTLTARIQLNLNLQNDLWPVWVDGHDLEDAILNLSINAMHAIDGNGHISIETVNCTLDDSEASKLNLSAGNYVVLSIEDNGCGMDDETREKLFEPFFTTKGEKGTGLGMSQVYGFVERSNGAISVISSPGRGSTIKIYFPRCLGNIISQAAESSGLNCDYSGSETVLVVDDEPALLNLAQFILNKQGYKTLCAENGSQALTMMENEAIDLMITDVIMPEMNGYKLAAITREKFPEIKIQLVSGFADEIDANIVDEELQNRLLEKPYTAQSLLKSVRDLLDARI